MWLADKPYRKPIGWLAFLYIAFVTLVCIKKFGDVPPGVVTVLMGLVAIPCTVVGSSSYEAVRQTGKEETVDDKKDG